MTITVELQDLLGMKGEYDTAMWPLPNMKPVGEMDFWGHQTTYSFREHFHAGYYELPEEAEGLRRHATLLIYYVGGGNLIDGGYAVLVDRTWKHENVKYFTWSKCDHIFTSRNVGRCLTRYTCAKCKKSYEVDSSD